MAIAPIQKRLIALEQRTLQPLLRVEPFPPPAGVEDVTMGGPELITIITGVPLAEPSDCTLDDLVGPVVGAPAAVADEVVDSEPVHHADPESELEPEADPIEVVVPERELVRHSLVPRVTVVPGASHISTGVGAEPVPLLRWVRQ